MGFLMLFQVGKIKLITLISSLNKFVITYQF